eukprot:6171868-Pleurochrysis_carterae.AAC.1
MPGRLEACGSHTYRTNAKLLGTRNMHEPRHASMHNSVASTETDQPKTHAPSSSPLPPAERAIDDVGNTQTEWQQTPL